MEGILGHKYSCYSFLLIFICIILCVQYLKSHIHIGTELAENSNELNIKEQTEKSNTFKAWTPPILPAYLQGTDQDDPRLLDEILEKWIILPFTGALNISEEQINRTGSHHDYSDHGLPTRIDKYLNRTENGFIVECGTTNGYINSNSLYFELHRKWNGILIEADPKHFLSLLEKQRHMFMINACISPTNKSMLAHFTSNGKAERIILNSLNPLSNTTPAVMEVEYVQCFPLYSILAALGMYHVNYFSLKIEGAVLDILKTIPYDELKIDIFAIEKWVQQDVNAVLKQEKEIINILRPHGFNKHSNQRSDIVLFRI